MRKYNCGCMRDDCYFNGGPGTPDDQTSRQQLPLETKSLGENAAQWLRDTAELLEAKAKQYGDSAGQPLRVFTTASPVDMLLIRAEDKLSRLVRGQGDQEDTVRDLVGYLALAAAAGWKGNNHV